MSNVPVALWAGVREAGEDTLRRRGQDDLADQSNVDVCAEAASEEIKRLRLTPGAAPTSADFTCHPFLLRIRT